MPLLFLFIIWAVVFGAIAARMAAGASRPVAAWAVYGAILGPVALLLIHMAPPGRCRRCEASVRGWEFVCRFCGEDVRGLPAARPALPSATPSSGNEPSVAPAQRAAIPARPASPSSAPATEAGARAGVTTERLAASTRSVERSTSVSASRVRRTPTGPVDTAAPAPAAPRPAVPAPAPASSGGRVRRRRGSGRLDPGRTIGAGLFLTGTASLLPGYRYAIAVTDTRLRILGPLDVEPEKVVVDRELAPFDAVVTEGRVMLTEGPPDRPRMFLVFEGISGTTPGGLADEIVRAVQAVPRAG